MASYKMSRTSEDILRELTAILRTVKDPRVNGPQGAGMLSIVRVEVTNDMSYATVYISSMDGLALHLRHVPELRFVADSSIEYSVNIYKKLEELEKQEKEGGGHEA